MVKTHWTRRVAALGTAMTLSLACCNISSGPAAEAGAAALCQETEIAGISLSLDKYYSTNFVERVVPESATGASSTAVPEEEPEATASPAPSETPAPEKSSNGSKSTTAKRKKTTTKKVSKRWQNTAISIADNYVNIRRHPGIRGSKVIGKLYKGSAAKILRYCKGGWVQIDSGGFKGYIKKEFLAIGADAEALADKYGTKYITVKEGTITLNVRQRTSTKSKILTQIPEEERFNVEKLCGDNWVRISLDDGRGYVAKEFVNVKVKFKKAISLKEERARARAKAAAERAEQERLRALAAERAAAEESSSGSSSSGSSSGSSSSSYGSSTGEQIAEYAQQFVGNKYVYGGTSLTNGTDCSGFTMSVYAQFGYSIPRTSSAQSTYGTSVSLSNVKPGDLIFYKNGGSVGHVAMYIGGGSVVHASNETDGIKISGMYYRQPCGARRIVG
ncbi:MAG: NlpC/P60 family protein [Lachnospiraceae bacterium]|nr:NlpC/P60 family protein [Lachnospiraceae bacterium]